MKNSKIFLLSLLLCFCFIQATSAATSEETYTSSGYYLTKMTDFYYNTQSYSSGTSIILRALDNAENYNGLSFLTYEGSRIRIQHNSAYIQYINSIPVTIDGYSAILSAEEHYTQLGSYVSTDIWIYFENPSLIKSLPSAPGYITVSLPAGYATVPGQEWSGSATYSLEGSSDHRILWSTQAGFTAQATRTQVVTTPYWENTLSAEYGLESGLGYITLTRNNYESNLSVYDLSNNLIYNNYEPDDISKMFLGYEYKYRLENAFGDIFEKILQVEDTTERITVLASVKNIQDYSVIGDSTISFVSDTENITRTMANGYDLFTLVKDTWYNVSASAEGFTPQLEYEPNLWTGSSAIDVWMIPTSQESNETVQMNFYVSESNSATSGNIRLKQAIITLNGGEKTLITDNNGYASTVLNRTGSISYIIQKEGYVTYSRTFSPNWGTYTDPTIDEHIQLLRIGEPIGGVTPVPTPDTRSSNQKAESAMNILFDNIEGIVQLAVVVLIISLISMIAGGGKKR